MQIDSSKVKETRVAALKKIMTILDAGDIEAQFSKNDGGYHSKDKFIVTWNGNYQGMPAEYSLCKTDAFYAEYSGYKAVYQCAGLFHEKQFKGYPSIEFGLLTVGMVLCSNRAEKAAFFDKYAKPYNERVKAEKEKKK